MVPIFASIGTPGSVIAPPEDIKIDDASITKHDESVLRWKF